VGPIHQPRPALGLFDQNRLSAKLPDGPVPCGRCELCKEFFDDDIYLLRGVTLCGDCRFFVRNGRWPSYERSIGQNARTGDIAIAKAEKRYHGKQHPWGS